MKFKCFVLRPKKNKINLYKPSKLVILIMRLRPATYKANQITNKAKFPKTKC